MRRSEMQKATPGGGFPFWFGLRPHGVLSFLTDEEFCHDKVCTAAQSDLVHAVVQAAGIHIEGVVHPRLGDAVVQFRHERAIHADQVHADAHVVVDDEAQLADVVGRVRLEVGDANRRLSDGYLPCSTEDEGRVITGLATAHEGTVGVVAIVAIDADAVSEATGVSAIIGDAVLALDAPREAAVEVAEESLLCRILL